MARPEQLLKLSSPVTMERVIPRLNVPIRFRTIKLIDNPAKRADANIMGGQLLPLFEKGEPIIDLDKIVPTALNLFDDNNLLEDTLSKLKLTGTISEIDVCNLQLGTFALHLLYRVKTDSGLRHFVSYVSRYAKDIPATYEHRIALGAIAESDFQNLSFLSNRFSQQRRYIRDHFNVVTPLGFTYTRQMGKEYGVYTTAFEDLGEVHVNEVPLYLQQKGRGFEYGSVPVYSYAIPLDPKMERENEILTQTIGRLKHKMEISREVEKIKHYPEYQALVQQQRNIILANAVLYLVGDRHFPERLTINAGDWMGTLNNKQFDRMTFITTRGLLRKVSEEEWVDLVSQQHEEDASSGSVVRFKPYANVSRHEIQEILQEAKRIIGL